MKVSIFQPTYLSWLGFYKAIDWSNVFVFLDDVQFENHSWQSRNRIKSANDELVLTVPIIRNFPQLINEVKINYSQDWIKKHLGSIQRNYCKAPFFKEFFPQLEAIYQSRPQKLIELNIKIIKSVCEFLEIKTDFHYSSEFNVQNLHKNDKLIAMLKKLNASQYIYAEGSAEYMQEALKDYQSIGVKLTPLKFVHPHYNQPYGEFVSHLSIIDIIFNCGREKTISIIKNINLLEK